MNWRTYTRWALGLVMLCPWSVVAAPDEQIALAVSDVVAERLSVRPEESETVTWRFRTSVDSSVTTSIFDSRARLVNHLQEDVRLSAGDHRVTWDGKDDSGRQAPPGYYLFVIEAERDGQKVRYDPTDSTGGEVLQASRVYYDVGAGLVHYALPQAALVRIHLGLTFDGPLLGTLADWVARSAGEHTESWNGWDASGVISFGESPDLDIQVWAYSLPVNAVVVERTAMPTDAGSVPVARQNSTSHGLIPIRTRFLEFPADRPVRIRENGRSHEMYNHWRHDRSACHNPVARLTAPAGTPRRESGAVLLTGPLPLRLELLPEEAAFLQEERFETVIYLDGSFVTEEEQGYLPFTWIARPEIVPPGEHVLTFMLRGYEGHFGTTSLLLFRPGEELADDGLGTDAITE